MISLSWDDWRKDLRAYAGRKTTAERISRITLLGWEPIPVSHFIPLISYSMPRQKVSSNVSPNDSQEIKPYKTFWLWQSATTGVNQTQLYTHFLRRSKTD